jgi:hypothetical protein
MNDYVTKPLRRADLARTLQAWSSSATEVAPLVLVPAVEDR